MIPWAAVGGGPYGGEIKFPGIRRAAWRGGPYNRLRNSSNKHCRGRLSWRPDIFYTRRSRNLFLGGGIEIRLAINETALLDAVGAAAHGGPHTKYAAKPQPFWRRGEKRISIRRAGEMGQK